MIKSISTAKIKKEKVTTKKQGSQEYLKTKKKEQK